MQKKFLSMILAIAMVLSMFAGITITASAASNITTGEYVIAANIDGVYYAMPNSSLTSKPVGAQITVTNGTVSLTDATDYRVIVTVLDNGNITISNDEGKYLGWSSSTNFANVDAYEWIPSVQEDGTVRYIANTTASASTVRAIVYRTSTYNYFGAYSVGNINGAEYYNVELLPVVADDACTHGDATSEVTTAPTCTETGISTWTCSCGATGTEIIAALGHTVNEWTVTTEPACTSAGVQEGACVTCGETITENIPATGHTYGDAVVTAPTCTEQGYSTVTCTACGEKKNSDYTAPAGHSYGEDGVCTVCGDVKAETKTYALVTVDTVAAGNYVIGAVSSGAYPTVYPATNACTGKDWAISATAVTAESDIISSDNLPVDAQIVTLEGDNTNGFTVSYTDAEGNVLYLGYTDYSSRKLTFSADYATTLWKVIADPDGGVALQNGAEDSYYTVSQNSTSIRGYASGTIYTGLYLFKEVVGSEGGEGETPVACEHANTTTTAAVEATCTTAGMTEKVTCDDCGEVISGGEEVAALGHNYVDGACSVCGIAEPTGYDLATTLNNYDSVVIYYPAEKVALTATASGKKLAGTAAEPVENKLAITDEMAVMTVNYVAGSETDFYLVSNNMYLTSGATGNSLTFAAEATDYAVWYIEVADADNGLVYIHNRNAQYNGGAQSMEYYSGFTTYGTKTTDIYKFQLYTEAGEAPSCEHSWGDWTVTVAPTCTAEGAQARTCTLCGEVQTDVVAATGHSYVYSETAITCSACDYNAEYTLSDIATVRAYEADKVYYFKGVVTFIDNRNVYVQDATAAIVMYMTNADAAKGLAIGDEILVWDTITTYNGLIETTNTTAQEYVKISSGNTPNTFNATVTALAEDFAAGEYQSEKVQLDNVVVTEVGTWSEQYQNYSMTVSDGTNTIYVYRIPAATADEVIAAGSTVKIKGIVAIYSGAYQLRIADAADIEVISTCAHETTELQNVTANDCINSGYSGDLVCTACGVVVAEGSVIPAIGHADDDGDTYCDECGEYYVVDAWQMSTTAPVAGNKYIIVAYDAEENKWYALPTADVNASTSNGIEVSVIDGVLYDPTADVIFAAREHSYTSNGTEYTGIGFYEKTGAKCIHLNSSKIRVTNSAQNGVFSFAAGSAENTYIMKGDVNSRYLTFSGTKFGVNSAAGTELYFFYQACEHEATAVTGAADATCTESGSTGATVCTWCATVVIEATEVPAFGHAYVYIDNGDGTHYSECCICLVDGVTNEEHTYVDGVCQCGAVEVVEPKYEYSEKLATSMSITVGAEMQVSYTILNARIKNYESFYVEIVKEVAGGESITTVYSLDANNLTDMLNPNTGAHVGYYAIYTGIRASQMGDSFSATLYAVAADGTVYYGPTNTSSIKTFLYEKIAAEASLPELKTLAVDMLNYGAAAQIYFGYNAENPVNADLTEEQKALGTQAIPAAVDTSTSTGDGGMIIPNVTLESKVVLYVNCRYAATEDSNLVVVIKDMDGNVIDEVTPKVLTAKICQAAYSNVGAKQMRQPIQIEMYDNGTLVTQTLTWSIESYVAQTRANTSASEALLNAVNAMLTYGDSAAAYLTATGQ